MRLVEGTEGTGSGRAHRTAGAALSVALAVLWVSPASSTLVVARVDTTGPAAAAGLRPDDRLLGWRAGDSGDVGGPLETPFDLVAVEAEHGSRGPVELLGSRDGEERIWILPGHVGSAIPTMRWRFRADPEGWGGLAERLTDLPEGAEPGIALETALDEAGVRRPAEVLWARWIQASFLARGGAPEVHRAAALASMPEDLPGGLGVPELAAPWLERRADVARRAGDPEAARRGWTRVIELGAPDALTAALAHRGLAIVAAVNGRPEDAIEQSRRSLAIFEARAPEGPALALDLSNLGYLEAERGRLIEGEVLLRRALDLYERYGVPVTSVRWQLAYVHEARGDVVAAERELRTALEESEAADASPRTIATLLSNLASAAERRGRLADAESWERRALALRERVAPESLDHAASLEGLASILLGRGRAGSEVEDLARRALAIAQRHAPGDLAEVGPRRLMARVVAEPTVALEHLERALTIARERSRGSSFHALVAYELAVQRRSAGQVEAALTLLREAIEALDDQLDHFGSTDELRSDFRGRFSRIYAEIIDLLAEQGRSDEALEMLERGRARGLLVMLRVRGVPEARSSSAEEAGRLRTIAARLDHALARLGEAPDEAERWALRSEVDDLRAERRALRSDRFRRVLPAARPLDVGRMRSLLAPGDRLVAFSVGERRSWRFESTADSSAVEATLLEVGRRDLAAQVDAFLQALEDSQSPLARRRAAHRARQLGELLLGSGRGEWEGARRLVLLLDGPLHGLPFAALRLPEVDGVLVEQVALQIVDSFAVLESLRGRPRGVGARTVLALGDPEVAGTGPLADLPALRRLREDLGGDALRSGGGFGLPAARGEVTALARLYGDEARVLVGAAATEEAVRSIREPLAVLHVASHGLVEPEAPLESALLLAVPSSWSPGEPDGLLQAWEVLDEVQLDVDLVTLSACSTARGRVVAHEGVLGLTRAFHVAGARSVLSSLWKVDDAATARLMESFYRHLAAGSSRTAALRQAQLELLASAGTDADFSAPVHWAAFQLSGDPGD